MDRAGVADVIERMGFPLRSLAVPSEVIAELARLTEGEPILLQLYVERLLELSLIHISRCVKCVW